MITIHDLKMKASMKKHLDLMTKAEQSRKIIVRSDSGRKPMIKKERVNLPI